MIKYTSHDLDIMARTVYGEADGNNHHDAVAIAWVIRNRYEYRRRAWGKSIAEVCKKPWQFSCWHDHDDFHRRNNQRILNVTQTDAWFRECIYICRKVLEGESADPTFRSTHYYANWVPAPKWAIGKQPVYVVQHKGLKHHFFYNDIDTPKPVITAVKDVVVNHPVKTTAAATATGIAGGAGVIELAQNASPIISALSYIPWQTGVAVVAVVAIGGAIWWWKRK